MYQFEINTSMNDYQLDNVDLSNLYMHHLI